MRFELRTARCIVLVRQVVRSLCEHEKEHGLETFDKLVPYSACCGAMPVGAVLLASGLAVSCYHLSHLRLSCAGRLEPS
jgi:hypothetical protein